MDIESNVNNEEMRVIKRNGSFEIVSFDKILNRVDVKLCSFSIFNLTSYSLCNPNSERSLLYFFSFKEDKVYLP